MENYFGVRKGAWTGEEDKLLRLCIEKLGEGKWHEVPKKAGLNRCRKSCRLRWLNYLKPNINRAEFTEDELDLIFRLHKLLGNRWSLIAGRLPGRTANDVKNYWNTHQRKKEAASRIEGVSKTKTVPQMVTRTNIFKPQPRAFSKKSCFFGTNHSSLGNRVREFNDHRLQNSSTAEVILPALGEDNSNKCWENILLEVSLGGDTTGNGVTDGSSTDEEVPINVDGLWNPEIAPALKGGVGFFQHGEISWDDLSLDVEIWDLLNAESI